MNRFVSLQQGAQKLGLDLTDGQIELLITYLDLMSQWNHKFNLTAITDPFKMLAYHALDSLSIASELSDCQKVLDVGSGAGLPGIPLAIVFPEVNFTLLDSNGKKTRFIQQAIAHCRINNANVVKQRVQDYHAAQAFDLIVSRAYASINNFNQSVSHLVNRQTRLLAMKTTLDKTEREAVDLNQFEMTETRLQVPGVSEPRTMIRLQLR